MQNIAIVTGGGTGIGKAIALEIVKKQKMPVLIVGRRTNPLEETAALAPKYIRYIPADVSTEEGRRKIADNLSAEAHVAALVHNAAVLGPVKPLEKITPAEWRQHQSINVEGPLFLTQKLIPNLKGGRVLHISSGAAHHAYQGWGAYCTSKAALYMLYRVFKEELRKHDIAVGSIRPGVVDTPMQDQVREASPEYFPAIERFFELKNLGQLLSPQVTARFIVHLLFEVSADKFMEKEWDIYDFL
ncbi:MAG TPA: SDR family NAD(P)-dependent oxidoreductase [Calditrichaeota bacterium]|nr:SDR family NAD(P)-dependent oxidoreductase [Calditrichota bacterium]